MTDFGTWVHVDPQAGPLFDQLRVQIIEGIRGGRLPAGTRLPTVRELAGVLGMAVNTVARSYRELEAAGVLETRGRSGTFVAAADPADAAMVAAARTFAESPAREREQARWASVTTERDLMVLRAEVDFVEAAGSRSPATVYPPPAADRVVYASLSGRRWLRRSRRPLPRGAVLFSKPPGKSHSGRALVGGRPGGKPVSRPPRLRRHHGNNPGQPRAGNDDGNNPRRQ